MSKITLRYVGLSVFLLVAGLAASASTPLQDDPVASLGALALEVVAGQRSLPFDGYLLAFCPSSAWSSLRADSDIGAFLGGGAPLEATAAVILLPSKTSADITYGVYFQGGDPVGVVEVHTEKGEKATDALVKERLIPVKGLQRGRLPAGAAFERGAIESDNGTSIQTLRMVSTGSPHTQQITKPATVSARPGESQSESGPHFDRARELYALGPTKAKEIIAELDLELRDRPENVKALLLKATTQMGIEQFDAALATLDQLSELAPQKKMIYPNAVFLRARCLFYKGEYQSAKLTLEPYWAFFQDDAEEKSQYESLMASITAKIQKPNNK